MKMMLKTNDITLVIIQLIPLVFSLAISLVISRFVSLVN